MSICRYQYIIACAIPPLASALNNCPAENCNYAQIQNFFKDVQVDESIHYPIYIFSISHKTMHGHTIAFPPPCLTEHC